MHANLCADRFVCFLIEVKHRVKPRALSSTVENREIFRRSLLAQNWSRFPVTSFLIAPRILILLFLASYCSIVTVLSLASQNSFFSFFFIIIFNYVCSILAKFFLSRKKVISRFPLSKILFYYFFKFVRLREKSL